MLIHCRTIRKLLQFTVDGMLPKGLKRPDGSYRPIPVPWLTRLESLQEPLDQPLGWSRQN